MNIALTGVSTTGKTTLANELAKDKRFIVHDEVTAAEVTKFGGVKISKSSSPRALAKHACDRVEYQMFREKALAKAKPYIHVFDKGIHVPLMYVLTQHAKFLSESEIQGITRDALVHASECYTHVVYLPLVNFNGESILQRNFTNKLVLTCQDAALQGLLREDPSLYALTNTFSAK
jgi:hypothetical protein